VRGVEVEGELTWYGVRMRGQFTGQRARDEDSGQHLQARADRFGTFEASYPFGAWTVGANVVASGPRYDAVAASDAVRMGGYARIDARVRYKAARFWQVELTAVNLGDKQYENSVGFSTPRRGVFLNVRFDAF
jgi:vitamin B12 transporter